jgi:uncharacterized protein YkwD
MIRLLCGLFLLTLLALAVPFVLAEERKKSPKAFEMSKDERTLLDLVNQERAKEKLPPLKPNPLLFKAARGHSANMAKQGKMEHILDKKKPAERVAATGYNWGKVTENLITADQRGVPLEKIVKGWMDSPLHKENLLGKDVIDTGLGIATNGKGEVYYTQVFARPRK